MLMFLCGFLAVILMFDVYGAFITARSIAAGGDGLDEGGVFFVGNLLLIFDFVAGINAYSLGTMEAAASTPAIGALAASAVCWGAALFIASALHCLLWRGGYVCFLPKQIERFEADPKAYLIRARMEDPLLRKRLSKAIEKAILRRFQGEALSYVASEFWARGIESVGMICASGLKDMGAGSPSAMSRAGRGMRFVLGRKAQEAFLSSHDAAVGWELWSERGAQGMDEASSRLKAQWSSEEVLSEPKSPSPMLMAFEMPVHASALGPLLFDLDERIVSRMDEALRLGLFVPEAVRAAMAALRSGYVGFYDARPSDLKDKIALVEALDEHFSQLPPGLWDSVCVESPAHVGAPVNIVFQRADGVQQARWTFAP